MIKMSGTSQDGKRQVLVLGLSEGNLMRLREKKPIVLYGEEVGWPGQDIIICWGETEDVLTKELHDLIGPETRQRDHRTERKN